MEKIAVPFLFLFSLLVAQTDTTQQIRLLQDKRVINSTELLAFLNSSNPKIRMQALLAIANIQDTTVVEEVVTHLHDSDAGVRTMAAFALGMLGKRQTSHSLFARLWIEKNDRAVREIFNAIGRCGTEQDLNALIENLKKIPIKYKPFIAEAFGRFSIRKIMNMNAYPVLVSLLADKNSTEAAMYALMRINDATVANIYSDEILPYLQHKSPHIRMWSAAILGNSTDETIKQRLADVAKSDADWRVKVNALRSLQGSPPDIISTAVKPLVDNKNEHVSLTALTALEGLLADDAINSWQPFFENIVATGEQYSPRQRGEAALILARRVGYSAVEFLAAQLDSNVILRPYIIKALGETKSPAVLETVSADIHHGNSLVSIVAIEAYQKIARVCNDSIQRQFLADAVTVFARKDAGISLTAAYVFEDTLFSRELRKEFLPQLCDAYEPMRSPNDIEPMIGLLHVFAKLADSVSLEAVEKGLREESAVIREAAEKAYRAITGTDSPVRFIKNPDTYDPFYNEDELPLLSKYSGAEISTTKGKIRITFAKEAAPFTVLNFILLAREKFYDGLTFHRVVSNFVIQGGDILGNGSGGPGYAIRTEVHPDARYTTGAVGMASAGKDTEGSQFFITHLPTPHLDGRYSIFAYTKDMDVVDKIMVGDKIESVVVY